MDKIPLAILISHIQLKVVFSDATFTWWLTLSKSYDITWFFPQILMIKNTAISLEESQLATPDQKQWSLMQLSLDDKNPCTKLRHQLILSTSNDDKRILQSDWSRDSHDHT